MEANTNNKKKFRNDIILIISLCITAFVACFFLYSDNDENRHFQLQILVDGELSETYDYSFDETFYKEISVDTGNTVVIENGYVYMKDAKCPDMLCVEQGKISRAGESIICLPHKLVVRIVDMSGSQTQDGLDVMPR